MKRALTVVLFRLFTIGVCVDGYEVSVTEGDSVTLKSGVTEIKTLDDIEWRFSGTLIATIIRDDVWVKADGSFRGRLQLDNQTGDLKIINIRTTDSGEYKPTINSPNGSPPEMKFTVKVVPVVVPAAAVKSVSVTEGDSVTLLSDPTEIQRDDVIQWRFGPQKSPVAEINIDAGISRKYDDVLDGRFKDRLNLNNQNGSLTIKDMRTTHTGLYEAEIIRTSSKHTIHKTFTVTVSDGVKPLSVTEGESVTLPITKIQNDDLIQWMFGDTVLAEINKTARRFYISDIPNKSFRNRLQLHHQTGSLTINNTRTTDSRLYEVRISSRRYIINRRISVTVTALPGPRLFSDVPDPGVSPAVPESSWSSGFGAGIGVCFGVLLAAAAAAAGVFYYRYKKCKKVTHVQKDPSLPLGNGDPGNEENEYSNG